MRRLQVQGCLPTLLVLVALVALGALAVTFGLAIAAITLGLIVVAWAVRLVRALLGGGGGRGGRVGGAPGGRVGPRAGEVEAVPPGWLMREPGGPVVEAEPRGGPGAERPTKDGESEDPPRG